jgi:hypothetical protein
LAWEALRRFVGRIAQPEVAVVDKHHAFFPVEDCRVFAAVGSVVASDADCAVVGQSVLQVGHLCRQCFLYTQQVRLLEVDEVDEVGAPRVPTVAGICVVAVLVPDVVGADGKLLGLHRKDGQQHEKEME